MAYTKEQLIDMYRIMQRSRLFDKKVERESRKGNLAGMYHFGTNQEGVEAGILPAIGSENYLKAYHRNHGTLSMCDMKLYVAGMLGRSTGYNRGMNGDFTQQSMKLRLLPIDAVVGEDWLHCTGMALGFKMQNKPGVVVCMQGDGAAQMGTLYEAMNFASLFKVPIVYVVVNNGIAMTTPTSKECVCDNIADRAAGFNVKGVTVWGQDPIAVREVMEAAIDQAKAGQPVLVEIKTYRKCGHYFGDPKDYLDPAYEEEMQKKYPDPIPMFEEQLISLGHYTQDDLKQITREIKDEIDDAFDWAYAQPEITKEMVLGSDKVFSNTEGGKL